MKLRSKYLVLTSEYLFPLLLIISLLVAYILAFHTPLFEIQEVTCELDYRPCQESAVTVELNKLKGQNLWRFDEAPLKERLLSGDFLLRTVQFTKLYPSTLRVTLLSSFPVLAIRPEGVTDRWVALDERFRIIAVKETHPNVPVITVATLPPLQLGQELGGGDFQAVMELALKLVKAGVPVTELVHEGGETARLQLESGLTVYFATSKDFATQLATLQEIMQDPVLLKDKNSLDLRFNQPVLK